MLTVQKQLALERWDLIPESLREAIVSDANTDALWDICKNEHLSDDKSGIVARLTGYVLLGFLRPEELSREIKDQLDIHPNIAITIAHELNKKILAPIRSELDRVYAPPGSEPRIEAVPPPSVLEEITPESTPTITVRELSADAPRRQTQPPSLPIERPLPPPPSPLPQAPPVPPPTPTMRPSAPLVDGVKPISGTQPTKLSPLQKTSEKIEPPYAPAPLSSSPVMIHNEVGGLDIQKKASGFRLDAPLPTYKEAKMVEEPLRPAKLEMGNEKQPPSSSLPVTREEITHKVVHYSEWSTPVQAPPPQPPLTPMPEPERVPPRLNQEKQPPPLPGVKQENIIPPPIQYITFNTQPQTLGTQAPPPPSSGARDKKNAPSMNVTITPPGAPSKQGGASPATPHPMVQSKLPPTPPPRTERDGERNVLPNKGPTIAPFLPRSGGQVSKRTGPSGLDITSPDPVTVRTKDVHMFKEGNDFDPVRGKQAPGGPSFGQARGGGGASFPSFNVNVSGGGQPNSPPPGGSFVSPQIYIVHEPDKPKTPKPPVPRAVPRKQFGSLPLDRQQSSAISWSEAAHLPFEPSSKTNTPPPPPPKKPEMEKEDEIKRGEVVDLSSLQKTLVSSNKPPSESPEKKDGGDTNPTVLNLKHE